MESSLPTDYLINKIGQMPEPIRVNGLSMSGFDFRDMALNAAEVAPGTPIVLTITGNPEQIPEVLGLVSAGAKVFTLPDFFQGELADMLSGMFMAAAKDLPNHSLASVSSGTSGMPKINVVVPYFTDPEMVEKMVVWGRERLSPMYGGRAFMTAPLQTTIQSYLATLGLEIPLSMMTERPSAETLSANVWHDDRSIMTKGGVVTKLQEAGYRRKFDGFLSASGPLGYDAIRAATEVFENPDVVDVYSCTEAGIVGARRVYEPFFQMAPMVTGLSDDTIHSQMTVGTITRAGLEKKDFVDTGDVIRVNSNLIDLVGRSKAKVSGFSVFPVEVRDRLTSRGYDIKSVYVEDGTLVCAHRGRIDEEALAAELVDYGLPFYSIPRRFVSVD